jgi:hypothetical protein
MNEEGIGLLAGGLDLPTFWVNNRSNCPKREASLHMPHVQIAGAQPACMHIRGASPGGKKAVHNG